MKAELERRESHASKVLDFFLARPYQWVGWETLAEVGGACAWRTRVSDARRHVQRELGGVIEWNGQTKQSAYRYVPQRPLGRDAAMPTQQKALF